MDKSTAQRIVKDTFKDAFDRDRFRNFVNELTNGFDETKKQTMQIPDAFKPHVASCQRIGTYESPEFELADILIVHLTESYKLERTRTALRDFVAHKLKRGDGEDNAYKEAALVAFVAPDTQSWRFSFVRMEYETKRDPKTGRIKPEERLTPARRYSYLVGAEEQCHTAQARFLDLLRDTTSSPTLTLIEEAFSVETVTKEFFNQYADLFQSTHAALEAIIAKDRVVKADFTAKGVCTVDFAKKLLGQIVFLYFIQKKGWLGVPKGRKWGDGPKDFMRKLADRSIADGKCLFNEVLEPLFYDTLATDRGHEAWCKPFACRIPFLNGGLFEPISGYDWQSTNLAFSNDLFTNCELTKEGDTGTGILDVFDRYNFTVNEAEPLEKEVAIDPEMLGKVFENLIEENRRKGLGTYYTPREIVHYMCQESLINYLDTTVNASSTEVPRADIEKLIREGEMAYHYESNRTQKEHWIPRKLPKSVEKNASTLDDALKSITVCDPAIGSGAFPVGMMTEIVKARTALTPYFNDVAERTPYHFKRHAIQNSIYGVDIDAGAVEIAKLRLWLSLVVDEEDVAQIKPLPNLDYKVVVGNSLMGFPFKSNRIHKIEALKAKFFDESDAEKKRRLREEIDAEISAAFENSKASLGYEVTFDFKIFFSEIFHSKDGFDLVIANPPYLFLSGKGSPVQKLRRDGKHEEAERLASIFENVAARFKESSKGCRDYYKWFIQLATIIGGKDSTYSYITPNTFISLKNYGDIRQIYSEKFSNLVITDLGFDVFEIPIVPSAVTIGSRKRELLNRIVYSDVKHVPKQEIKHSNFYEIVESTAIDVNMKDGEYCLYKHPIADKIYSSSEHVLGDIATFSEGEHNMKVFPDKIRKIASKNCVPAIFDKEMQRNSLAEIVWIPQEDCQSYNEKLHSGDRCFLRKTGDSILVCPPSSFSKAVAHQNVYVVKSKCPQWDIWALIGLLSSTVVTFLYQAGIYGQKGRTLAQFRIYGLEVIPIPGFGEAEIQALSKITKRIFTEKSSQQDMNMLNEIVFRGYDLKHTQIKTVTEFVS